MGLAKKPPCPICGGAISWLLPLEIEDEYICSACFNKIDMQADKANNLTIQGFREYLAFFDQNRLLKDKFEIFELIDFGVWDTKIIFDYHNKLFCMSKNPDKTVFEGKQLESFTIREDNTILFEGSAACIKRYESTVPERAMALAPQISQFLINRQMACALDKPDDGSENRSAPNQYSDITEPFRAFNVELHFDHPYWTVIKCDMDGPRFDDNNPDVNDYLKSYKQSIEEIEKLVTALRIVAFPKAAVQSVGFHAAAAITEMSEDCPSLWNMKGIQVDT